MYVYFCCRESMNEVATKLLIIRYSIRVSNIRCYSSTFNADTPNKVLGVFDLQI